MIHILTDSSADFLPAEAARLQVQVVPLNLTFEDGTVVRDGLDLTSDEFYTRLAACDKLPTTSQPSPDVFMPYFEQAKQAGEPTVAILISGALSGTLQSAQIAAQEVGYEDLYLVDSQNATLGLRLLVELALRLRDEGKTAAQIAETLEEEKGKVRLLAVVDDLKYFRKGGRLPAAAAFAGTIMGIKPVVSVIGGKVALAGKARGLPGAYVALFKLMDQQGGLDAAKGYVLGYTAHRKGAEPLHRYLTGNLHLPPCPVYHIGTVVGTHVGPGAAGIAFFAKGPMEG